MKIPISLAVLAVSLAVKPTDGAVTPDTVVATINGRKVTAAEVERILTGVPPQMQEALRKDRKDFLRRYALVSLLAEQAERDGLAEKSPYKEQLAWNRVQVLLQAAISEAHRRFQEKNPDTAEEETKKWLDEIRETATMEPVDEDYFSGDAAKAARVPDDTVVVKLNGREITAGEIKFWLLGATNQVRENFLKNREEFLRQYAMTLRLVEIAEKQRLDQKTPYKEQLQWVRVNTLSQARLNEYSDQINIGRKEEQEYYAAHKDDYTRARVKVIYIPFGSDEDAGKVVNGKKVLSEEEALALTKKIRKELAAGADFVEMVKRYSEDETSKAKDGDFGTIRKSDKLPEHIKEAIFRLKPGEVTEPLRQPNGYYLFRVEEVGTQTLDEVRQTLNRQAKAAKFREWFDQVVKTVQFDIENEEYFNQQQQ